MINNHHEVKSRQVQEAHDISREIKPGDNQLAFGQNTSFWVSPCEFFARKRRTKNAMKDKLEAPLRSRQKYDERRLIDARFWVFMVMVSNILFQITNTLAPLVGTRQLEVNIIYWFITLALIVLCLASFINIELIPAAVVIIFLRNLAPMFDFEQRKELMSTGQWEYMVVDQTVASMISLMILMNCLDKYILPISFIMVSSIILSAIEGIFGVKELVEKQAAKFVFQFFIGQIFLAVFLYIQKRMHKEVFIEVKKKNQLQSEFKTIFDELDAAIMIMSKERITHLNMAFSWFLLQHFGSETMTKISSLASSYEASELEKENQQTEEKKSKLKKVFEFLCCWRRNYNRTEMVHVHETQQFKYFQQEVLSRPIFKVYALFGQDSSKSSARSSPQKSLSLAELLEKEKQELDKLILELPSPLSEGSTQFVQVKVKEYLVNETIKFIVQIIDVSHDILYQKAHAENEFLSIANATVSHELRNPLQSILSQGLKLELCIQELVALLEVKQNCSIKEASDEIKDVVRTLKASNSIQQSSSSMMAFLVDDILDFSQIKANKFRKQTKTFVTEEVIEQIISIQKDKAEMLGISLKAQYYPQLDSKAAQIVSLFRRKKHKQSATPASADLSQLTKPSKKAQLKVNTDPHCLQQVLLNLQSNAIKFTGRGGEINVAYTTYFQAGKPYLEIQVKDNGMGIKQEDQEKLFKLFGFVESTQEMNTRGIGLGLVISSRICDSFSGDIGFQSTWGEGSLFGFRFRLEEEPVEEAKFCINLCEIQPEQIPPPFVQIDENKGDSICLSLEHTPGLLSKLPSILDAKQKSLQPLQHEIMAVVEEEERARGRILIVDDEPFNVDSLQVILQCALPQAAGLERRIDRAFNGHEAVEQFKRAVESDLKYTLILMDCNMPKMDGYTATALIKQFARDVGAAVPYVMAVTAHSEEKYVERCLESGMDFVLPKPAGVQQLKEAVNHLSF